MRSAVIYIFVSFDREQGMHILYLEAASVMKTSWLSISLIHVVKPDVSRL